MDSFSHYHCSSEWHFAKLTGQGAHFATLLYSFALHLSGKPGIFWASIPNIATHFDLDERTVRKAIKLLKGIGFFEVVSEENGKSVKYRVIGHRDWRQLHPGRCIEKCTMPWEAEEGQDRLAVELYRLSGGRFKLYANVLKGIRKTGHSETAIKEHFVDFIDEIEPEGRQWVQGLAGKFIKYLKEQEVEDPAPAPPPKPTPAAQPAKRVTLAQLAGRTSHPTAKVATQETYISPAITRFLDD